ncbi:MAG: hypothetical protein U0263_39110 [Polyangiaceae bacterium]
MTLGKPGMVGVSNVFTGWLDARSSTGTVNLDDAEADAPALLNQYQIVARTSA